MHIYYTFFGQDIFEALQLDQQAEWILEGDYNCVLKPIDIEGGFGFNQKKYPSLGDLVVAADLVDSFRAQFPVKHEFTFFRASCAPSRLYIPAGLVGEVLSVTHMASLSDHCGIKLRIKLCIDKAALPIFTRSTYWKLNSAMQRVSPNFFSILGQDYYVFD